MEARQAGTVQHIHLRIHHVWGISLTSFISFWPSASGPRLGPSAAQSVFTQLVPLPGDRWLTTSICVWCLTSTLLLLLCKHWSSENIHGCYLCLFTLWKDTFSPICFGPRTHGASCLSVCTGTSAVKLCEGRALMCLCGWSFSRISARPNFDFSKDDFSFCSGVPVCPLCYCVSLLLEKQLCLSSRSKDSWIWPEQLLFSPLTLCIFISLTAGSISGHLSW